MTVRAYDLVLPLLDDTQATLRIPRPMSEENYALLRELLDLNLGMMRKALVAASPSSETGPAATHPHEDHPVDGCRYCRGEV